MRSTSSKVPHGILGIVPFLLAIFGAVVASLPLGIDGGANAGLPLSLIIVFFWLARRPGLLPSLALACRVLVSPEWAQICWAKQSLTICAKKVSTYRLFTSIPQRSLDP